MKLNRTGPFFDREYYNKENENWDKIEGNFNNVVQEAIDEGMEQVIDGIKLNYLDPVETFTDIDSTYPNPSEGDAVQVIDEGKVYRFNGTEWEYKLGIDPGPYNQLDKKLSDFTKRAIGYGKIDPPHDFQPNLPCDIYRDFDGKVKHNMDFSQYKQGTELYVDQENGLTTNDGSSSNPYKYIVNAMDHIINGSDESYKIIVRSTTPFFRDESWNENGYELDGKKVAIVPENEDDRITMTSGDKNLSWSSDENVYRSDRTNVSSVYDLNYKDLFGVYIPYKNVDSISDCKSTPGSYYHDGNVVWVNTLDGQQPTNDSIIVNVDIAIGKLYLRENAKFYIENADYLGSNDGLGNAPESTLWVRGSGEAYGEYCANNCTYSGGKLKSATVGNVVETVDLKTCYFFNCIAAYGIRDGFNHHYADIEEFNPSRLRDCLAMRVNCISYDCGLESSDMNNNAFTSHEGASVFDVNCIGYNTKGPVYANVGGCYTIAIDCHMRDSELPNDRDAYDFQDYNSGNGVAYLINCDAGGEVRYDLRTDHDVYLNNFRGRRISGMEHVTFLD